MSRLNLEDSILDMFVKMSEGNPGAMTAMMQLSEKSPVIDPQSALGSLGPIFSLDTHGIYGSSIYILWSDKCGRDTRKMCLLLRAVQLGIFPEHRVQAMAADQMRQVEMTADEWLKIDTEVCSQLEGFQRPNN